MEQIAQAGQQLRALSSELLALERANVRGDAILEVKERFEVAETNFLWAIAVASAHERRDIAEETRTLSWYRALTLVSWPWSSCLSAPRGLHRPVDYDAGASPS